MAAPAGFRRITSEVDLVHVECSAHLQAYAEDEDTGSALFFCPACKKHVMVSPWTSQPEDPLADEKGVPGLAEPGLIRGRSGRRKVPADKGAGGKA